MEFEKREIGIFIYILVMCCSLCIGVTASIKNNKIAELDREINRLKEVSVKKSAMMLSYADGYFDGLNAVISLCQWSIFQTNKVKTPTLEKVIEFQAIQFLKDKGIYDIPSSNYMMKALERIK